MEKPPQEPLRPDQRIERRISDRHCELMGEFIAEWSILEANLDMSIWDAMSLTEDDGRLLTNRFDANIKVQILRVIVPRRISNEAFLTKFSKLALRIDELRDDRNFIVHATWATLMPEDVPFGSSVRQKSPVGTIASETFPKERVETMTKDAKIAIKALGQLAAALRASRGI